MYIELKGEEMDMSSANHELLSFFKALADANRLKIVGLLASRAHTVEQISAILGLSPSTVSHHMGRLSEAGLVSARAEGYYSVYELNVPALEAMAKRLLSTERLISLVDGIDLDAFDRKVLGDYLLPDGRLKTVPAQRKKLEAVLRHVVKSFETGKRYPEKQVNEILKQYHEDTASLRRELVGYKLMMRQSGEYWRSDEA
jgi:predicted transcriptional regulator